MSQTVKNADVITDAVQELMGLEVSLIEKIGRGRNSEVYKAVCGDESFAVKLYSDETMEGRSRIDTEFSSLKFLWDNNVDCVPRPHATDKNKNLAVFEFVSGNTVESKDVSAGDMENALNFLSVLKKLSMVDGSERLPHAAEACFATEDIVKNIRFRYERLVSIRGEGIIYNKLSQFLNNGFAPSFERFSVPAVSLASGASCSDVGLLDVSKRTLSPSDFGFHNSIKDDDGKLTFIDFEYFGWDDPAKTTADFLLHPAMQLTDKLRAQFVNGMVEIFGGDEGFYSRFQKVYPLFALKWVMIILNEFLPEFVEKRGYADDEGRLNDIRAQQLQKASAMLENILAGDSEFI